MLIIRHAIIDHSRTPPNGEITVNDAVDAIFKRQQISNIAMVFLSKNWETKNNSNPLI